jgi:hypothetical protein
MEKFDDTASSRLDRREVGPLPPIAAAAGPRQVFKTVVAPMLPGNHMFQMKRLMRISSFRQTTVLTTTACALGDSFTRHAVH